MFFATMLRAALLAGEFDGVTISGGEPFEQQVALSALVNEIRDIEGARGAEWDILVYTGYSYPEIEEEATILAMVDVVVSGRYDRALPEAPLRGSSNQALHRLSERARLRYSDEWLSDRARKSPMDVSVAGGNIVLAGIARQGDLPTIARALGERGVGFRGQSWGRDP